jgi:two-component system, cell cycle response regulator
LRILIAEDDFTSRTILTAMLEKWGFDPLPVSDGEAAWETMQKPDAPKLAILDWNMPRLDGLEVCRRIRKMKISDPPYVIILTSKGEKLDIVRGLEAGGNDYISKPYDNAELQARIKVGQRMIELQSSLIQAKEAMAHQAMHDPLTGILNRRAILHTVEKEISRAKRSSASLSIGMLDVDHFKQVNDTHGHQVGDDVLCGIIRCIQSCLRDYDYIGRYGGEEFLVIAPGCAGSPAENLYKRLCVRVAQHPIATRDRSISVTVSIGVAEGNGESTVDAILTAADAALYRAKDEGRDRICLSL